MKTSKYSSIAVVVFGISILALLLGQMLLAGDQQILSVAVACLGLATSAGLWLADVDLLEEQVKSLGRNNAEMGLRESGALLKVDQLKQDLLDELKRKEDDRDWQVKNLASKNIELVHEISSLKAELGSAKGEVGSLKGELASLKADKSFNEVLDSDCFDSLEQQLEWVGADLSDVKQHNSILLKDREVLEQELRATKDSLASVKTRLNIFIRAFETNDPELVLKAYDLVKEK
jgi:chromosome segregation ATPase